MKKSKFKVLSILMIALMLTTTLIPLNAFAAEAPEISENVPIVITTSGVTEDGITYICRDVIEKTNSNSLMRAPMSLTVTRTISYGSFATRDAAIQYRTQIPASISWVEDIGGATLARGTLYYLISNPYQYTAGWQSRVPPLQVVV